MIKYHEYRTCERDYGDDHKFTNNWNPEQNYGKEYAKVYFNMESEGYCYPSSSFTEEQRKKLLMISTESFLLLAGCVKNRKENCLVYVLYGKKEKVIHASTAF